jgi:hypothetical protein
MFPKFSPNGPGRISQCTPEFVAKQLAIANEGASLAANEMRAANNITNREKFNNGKNQSIMALSEIKRVCGKITIPSAGKSFSDPKRAWEEIYGTYKARYDAGLKEDKSSAEEAFQE